MLSGRRVLEMKRIFLAIAFVLVLSLQASATDYYVSKQGKDSRNGTSPATAWKTINKVNSADFGPGDSIFFKGGQSFSGNLYFDETKTGTASSPLTIGSYDTGRATINADNGKCIFVYNTAGVDIINLNCVGSGSTANTSDGILFYSESPGDLKHERVYIDQVDVRGFGNFGVCPRRFLCEPNGIPRREGHKLYASRQHEGGFHDLCALARYA